MRAACPVAGALATALSAVSNFHRGPKGGVRFDTKGFFIDAGFTLLGGGIGLRTAGFLRASSFARIGDHAGSFLSRASRGTQILSTPASMVPRRSDLRAPIRCRGATHMRSS